MLLKVTEDEIANAAGISDMHDGVNFMRAACVIAVEKVRTNLEQVCSCRCSVLIGNF